MSIIRFFSVVIDPGQRIEFEIKFNTLSKGLLQNAPGCASFDVLRPSKWAPDEYAMISRWEHEAALVAFVGENWNESVIPSEMEKFVRSHSTYHFRSWD